MSLLKFKKSGEVFVRRNGEKRNGENMKYIGKVERIKNDGAVIVVTKELPCGEHCRGCSAGCKFYKTHIQAQIPNEVKVGDRVRIERTSPEADKSSLAQYLIPALMIGLAMMFTWFIPVFRNNNAMMGLSLLIAVIASQFALKGYSKFLMKKNAKNFSVGEKIDLK